MRILRGVMACGVSLGLAACGTMHVSKSLSADDEQSYAALYPYYAELCALSQFKKKPGFGAEVSSGLYQGIGGHAVLYLNGVCRVADAHYPTVALCSPEGSSPADSGVGISINAHYKNATWIATPGRDFFFHGGLKPHQKLTRDAYRQTQAAAESLGILDGVEFHSEVFAEIPPGMSEHDYMYEVSVATDYAIGFGRDRYCGRVPLQRAQMARVVAFLNELNEPYKEGKREFEWDVLRNNCSHVLHNALAAAGVWRPWPTEQFLLLAAVNFPVPKNEFVNLMRRTNDLPLDDPDALYRDEAGRRALMEQGWLPTEPGALAEAERVVQDNEVYATDLSLIFYDDPIIGVYRRRFARIFAEPRYTELRANLAYFDALYRRIGPADAAARGDEAEFDRRFDAYIAGERARVEAALGQLDRPVAPVAAAQH